MGFQYAKRFAEPCCTFRVGRNACPQDQSSDDEQDEAVRSEAEAHCGLQLRGHPLADNVFPIGGFPGFDEEVDGDAKRGDTGSDHNEASCGMLHQRGAPILGRGISAACLRAFHEDDDRRDAECGMGQARHDLSGAIGVTFQIVAFILKVEHTIHKPPERVGEKPGRRDPQQDRSQWLADQEIQRARRAFGLAAIQRRKECQAANDQVDHTARTIACAHEPFDRFIGMVSHPGPFRV